MLDPRRVLITGGTKGMGLAIAKQFLRVGDHVVVASRNEAPVRVTHPDTRQATWVRMDMSEDMLSVAASTREALHELDPKSGRHVDVLILAGGMGAYNGWRQSEDPDVAFEMMRTNFFGPRRVLHTCIPALRRRHEFVACECVAMLEQPDFCWKCGQTQSLRMLTDIRGPSKVIWLGSTVIHPPGAKGLEDYAASKGAVFGYMPSAARVLARWGIRMVSFDTSWVDTPMTQAIQEQNPQLYHRITRLSPLRRMATSEEAAQAVYDIAKGPEYWHGARVAFSGGAN